MAEADSFDDPGTHLSSGLPSGGLPSGFRAAVSHALAGLGYSVVNWEADGVNVRAPAGAGPADARNHAIGLANLYRRARAVERAEWPDMIREFLGHITGTFHGPDIPDDLSGIVGQLRPRLGRPFSREAKAVPWGVSVPGTGLEINLVIDYPNTMAYVTDKMLETTTGSSDDLLDVALANLRTATGDDFLERVSDEIDIYVGHSGDGYDAARALLVEDLLPECPAGFLVAVPSRDELAVWPVSAAMLPKIHVIKLFARDNFRDHAYPITEDVFWVWQGTWYRFGIEVDDASITISPPEEFVAALGSLTHKTHCE